jgi:tRNA threonylcarbamoyladenosine modification (KEOPS) complex  Pcc1 subunit
MNNKYFIKIVTLNEELCDKALPSVEREVTDLLQLKGKADITVEVKRLENGFTIAMNENIGMYPTISLGQEPGIHTETEFDKANNFVITIDCDSEENAEKVATRIHENFRGNSDYVDSKILLNFDGTSVTIGIGAETDFIPLIKFVADNQ